jgi:hypothetical protein
MIDITSTDSEAHCAYFDTITAKGDCIGLLLSTLTSSNGNCFGDLYKGITSNTADAFGMYMTSINGKTTHALYAEDVIASSFSYGVELVNIKSTGGEARGISMSPVTARTNGFGIRIDNVTSESGNAYGSYTSNISTNGGFAQGSEISKVVGLQGSYGLNIHDVNCEAKDSYGIRVDSVNAPSANAYGCILTNIGGSRQYGFYQRGALNVGNIFDSFVDCGGSTGLTDPPALNVRGSTNTTVQFFTTATATATVNGGNIIICSGGVITTLNLPSSPPDGLTYQLWKPSTPTLTINGVTHLINGVPTQSIATGSPTNPQNISLTYSSALGQWLYHVN